MSKDNPTELTSLFNRAMKEDYSLTSEEKEKLGEIREEIKDFVDHWDEDENRASPFFYINMLNKMASRDFVVDGVDLARLAALFKKVHGKSAGFVADVLDKDSNGNFAMLKNSMDGYKLLPIEISLSGVLDAFVEKMFDYHRTIEKHFK